MLHVADREIVETGEGVAFSPLQLVTYAFLFAVRKSSSRQVF